MLERVHVLWEMMGSLEILDLAHLASTTLFKATLACWVSPHSDNLNFLVCLFHFAPLDWHNQRCKSGYIHGGKRICSTSGILGYFTCMTCTVLHPSHWHTWTDMNTAAVCCSFLRLYTNPEFIDFKLKQSFILSSSKSLKFYALFYGWSSLIIPHTRLMGAEVFVVKAGGGDTQLGPIKSDISAWMGDDKTCWGNITFSSLKHKTTTIGLNSMSMSPSLLLSLSVAFAWRRAAIQNQYQGSSKNRSGSLAPWSSSCLRKWTLINDFNRRKA